MNSEFSAQTAKYQFRQKVQPTIAPLSVAISGALAAGTLQASTITVDTLSGSLNNDDCSLRAALYSATTNGAQGTCTAGESGMDTIEFQSGLVGTIVLSASDGGYYGDGSTLAIGESVSIDGDDRITIQGSGDSSVFYAKYDDNENFNADAVTIQNLEITDGGGEHGGAIRAHAPSLHLQNTVLSGHSTSSDGGAVYHEPDDGSSVDPALMIHDTLIEDNESTSGNGGGVYATTSNGEIALDAVEFRNNTATAGGGLHCLVNDGELNATDITGVGNTSGDSGGAVAVFGLYSSIDVAESHFNDNQSGYEGGALFIAGRHPEVSVRGSVFRNNAAYEYGGAVHISTNYENSVVNILNSEISNGTSYAAGVGVSIDTGAGASAYIENSTISNNLNPYIPSRGPYASGAGLFLTGDGSVDVKYSTIAYNETLSPGAGIYNEVADCSVVNSVLAYNESDIGGDEIAGSYDCTVSDSLLETNANGNYADGGGNLLGVNPELQPLADNGGSNGRTHAITPSSPVLNAGSEGSFVPNYDQRGAGYERISGPIIDMGAYELQGGGDTIFEDRFEQP